MKIDNTKPQKLRHRHPIIDGITLAELRQICDDADGAYFEVEIDRYCDRSNPCQLFLCWMIDETEEQAKIRVAQQQTAAKAARQLQREQRKKKE